MKNYKTLSKIFSGLFETQLEIFNFFYNDIMRADYQDHGEISCEQIDLPEDPLIKVA